MKQADDNFQSWTYWDSEFFDSKDGSVYWDRVKAFARTYTRAVAGTPQRLSFNVTTAEFFFSYLLNANTKAPTEIFVPIHIHYINGFNVNITPSMSYTFSKDDQILKVNQLKHNDNKPNTLVTVRITKK